MVDQDCCQELDLLLGFSTCRAELPRGRELGWQRGAQAALVTGLVSEPREVGT